MTSVIHDIYDWQVAAGNVERGYDDFLESSFQIEEALEPFQVDYLSNLLKCEPTRTTISRAIVECTKFGDQVVSDVDRLDKACDAIVFAIGSIAKLGLNPDQLCRALSVVNDANQAKLGCPRDSEGKLLKPDDFPNPEPRLQEILDERV